MIICFDLRALQTGHQNRGIGMYIKSVLEHLPKDDNSYSFYVFDKSDPIKDLDIKLNINYKLIKTRHLKTALNSPRDLFGLIKLVNHRFKPLKAMKPDVFIQFDFTLGAPRWTSTKIIIIGYDLIPLIMKNEYLPSLSYAMRHPSATHRRSVKKNILRSIIFRVRHLSFSFSRPSLVPVKYYSVLRSVYYRLKYKLYYKTYRRASKIISISKATENDFVRLLNIDSAKLTTIPLAPVLPATNSGSMISKKIKKPYVLYIGGTDARKRIQDIVHAFDIARGRGSDLSLVLAGNEFTKLELLPSLEGRNAILNSPYKDDIILLGFISDTEKITLYASAHAFIFCTIYEGFGLPIIEAMAMSCPVISYNNSSIPEAAGDAALLVDTGDYVAVANKIVALFDPKLRASLAKKGLVQAAKFNWHTYIVSFKKAINIR